MAVNLLTTCYGVSIIIPLNILSGMREEHAGDLFLRQSQHTDEISSGFVLNCETYV